MKKKGFTLIEILVVVALIAILAAITIVAINPSKNFGDTRNATRSANVNAILNAVTQYTSEQGHAIGDFGTVPACGAPVHIGSASGLINLSTLLVSTYLVSIPIDPTTGTATDSGYTICQTNGRVTIAAPSAENSKVISAQR